MLFCPNNINEGKISLIHALKKDKYPLHIIITGYVAGHFEKNNYTPRDVER